MRSTTPLFFGSILAILAGCANDEGDMLLPPGGLTTIGGTGVGTMGVGGTGGSTGATTGITTAGSSATTGATTTSATTGATTGAGTTGGSTTGGGTTGTVPTGPGFDPPYEDATPSSSDQLDRSGSGEPCGFWAGGANGYGGQVGQRLPNLQYIMPSGEQRTFSEFACSRDNIHGDHNVAYYVMFTAGWCGNCGIAVDSAIPQMRDIGYEEGIETIVIMMENSQHQPPTLADCQAYKAQHNINFPFRCSPDQSAMSAFGGITGAFPFEVALDANGNIVCQGNQKCMVPAGEIVDSGEYYDN